MKSPFTKSSVVAKFEQRTRARRTRVTQARCNICDRMFRADSSFHRFCKSCKEENELFKFYEWLPQA